MATDRRITRRRAAQLALGALAAPQSSLAKVTKPKPNFVVLLADDLPIDGFTTAMAQFKARPDITYYKNAYSGPECDPMRATLLSGLYDFHHGVQSNLKDWNFDHTRTVAYALQRAGYTTALYGKLLQQYQSPNQPMHQPPGWTDFQGFVGITPYMGFTLDVDGAETAFPKSQDYYETDILAAKGVNFILANANRPFFLWVACHNPHQPTVAAHRHATAFKKITVPHGPSFGAIQTNAPAWVKALSPVNTKLMDNVRTSVWRTSLAIEDAALRLLQTLQSAGILENTIFVFATDQGVAIGEHNWTSKRDVYQPTVNAPFAVRWPQSMGIAGGENSQLISFVDLAPTILGLAGVTPTWTMDGINITSRRRNYVLLHWIGGGGGGGGGDGTGSVPTPGYWAVTDGSSKYVELSTGETELYDLKNDPYEMVNLAGQPGFAALQAGLATQLRAMKP